MSKDWKYIEYLLTRKCFPDFIRALDFKVDLKEWTETIGMLNQIMEATKDRQIDCAFDVGCGKRPTLGTLMALNVKSISKIICIDPQLDTSLAKDVVGLTLVKERLVDYVTRKKDTKFGSVLICCNHSHVAVKELRLLMELCESWIYVTNPCCVDNKLLETKGQYFKDKRIWSPKNEIFIFNSQNG